MKLATWLKTQKMAVQDAAERLGVSRQTLHGWGTGDYQPTAKHLAAIHRLTDGAVTALDFDDTPTTETAS